MEAPLRLPVLLLLLAVGLPLAAQPTHYALTALGGEVIATNGSPYDGKCYTAGGDVALFWQQDDTSLFWTRYWHSPLFGLRVNYAHVVQGIAGNRLGLAGTMQGPLVGHLAWTYSVGLSFYDHPYRRTHNASNTFIGSYLNCYIDLGFQYNVGLGADNTLCLAAKLVHSSNGYMYKPNHGLNYLQLEVGLLHGPPRRPQTLLHRADSTFRPHGAPFVVVAPGAVMSRYDPIDLIRHYPTYSLQLGYLWHAHPCFSYGASLDLSYNFSHRRMAPEGEWPVYPAAGGFVDTQWGPWVLRVGLAHYLAYYPLNWEQYYERVGIFYRFGRGQRQRAGVAMKVHYDHIDFIEWSYGIEL